MANKTRSAKASGDTRSRTYENTRPVSERTKPPLKIAYDNDVEISGGFPLSIRRGIIYQEMPNNYYCLAHITHRWSAATAVAAAALCSFSSLFLCRPVVVHLPSLHSPTGRSFFSSFPPLCPRPRLSFARASFRKRNARYKHAAEGFMKFMRIGKCKSRAKRVDPIDAAFAKRGCTAGD